MRLFFILAAGCALFAQQRPAITQQTIDQWMKELSNWGRWGKEDQLGTVNLITAEKRRQAALLVKDGVSVSLAHDTLKEKAVDNSNPFSHEMKATGARPFGQYSVDEYKVSYHGYAHTHMDSLCHIFYKGQMYNGFKQETITDAGAQKLAVTNFKNGIFTRGILMDIPKLKGVPYLEPGTPIYPEDLDAWEKQAGIKVASGDVVFIRTGRWALRAAKGPWDVGSKSAGLHASCARWLKSRDVAMLGSDAASDVMPSGVAGVVQPIHQLILIALGTPIFDNCDLEAVSAEAAKRKRYAFLITASPIPVPGGTGSPLNPIAVF
ncbi:MAG TPA: cyclase family protein [Bryobacteraceae bacterium]|nr:cyclase family protein [Bryobacteraceae bacterium]